MMQTNIGSTSAPVKRRRRVNRKLGPFASLVLRSVVELPRIDRYGLAIAHHVAEVVKVPGNFAQIYVSLHRMESYGYLTANEEPYSKSEPRPVRRYTITAAGEEALKAATEYYATCMGAPSAPTPKAKKKK